jgi:hypothetical protein
MSTTSAEPRRSTLMWVLRASPLPVVLTCVAGGILMGAGASKGSEADGRLLWEVGYHVLVLGGLLFVALLWGGVYLEVVEASRGMPGLKPVSEPEMKPEVADQLRALERSLSNLGFRREEWFCLDDFARTHVGAWQHESHPAAAFVLYYPDGEMFRLRFIRWFPSGGVLVSSTRLVDLACPPPEGVYLQVKKGASAEELWAWHLEAEALFPDAPGDGGVGPPRELFVALFARWASHKRRDRTWLLAVEPFGECWRLYHLCGMPLEKQFELGWATPFWR